MTILGASFDPPEENRKFKEKYSYPFPLLCDTTRELGMAYGACAAADAGFADRVTAVVGPDGKIAKFYAKVAPKTHPDEVLADVRAMQV